MAEENSTSEISYPPLKTDLKTPRLTENQTNASPLGHDLEAHATPYPPDKPYSIHTIRKPANRRRTSNLFNPSSVVTRIK